MIRVGRQKKNLTQKQLAKKLGITSGYLEHLEIDTPVRLSARVVYGLMDNLRLPMEFYSLIPNHNKKTALLYRSRAKSVE